MKDKLLRIWKYRFSLLIATLILYYIYIWISVFMNQAGLAINQLHNRVSIIEKKVLNENKP